MKIIKNIEKEGFIKRFTPYNKPFINVVTGLIASMVQGCITPLFGCMMAKVLFSYMTTDMSELRK